MLAAPAARNSMRRAGPGNVAAVHAMPNACNPITYIAVPCEMSGRKNFSYSNNYFLWGRNVSVNIYRYEWGDDWNCPKKKGKFQEAIAVRSLL
jgi:hypothetical protein